MRYFDFTAEDEARFIELTRSGLAAAFVYSNKVLYNGQRTVLNPDDRNERVVAFSGTLYAPLSFFTDILGAECKKRCGRITLALGGKSTVVKDNVKTGYLPVKETCEALGLATRLLCEDTFIVVGDADAIKALDTDAKLVAAGPYAVFGDYTVDFTDEDYEAAAKNFHDRLVGTEKTNDLSNPNVKAKIDAINDRCREALAGLDRSGDPAILWGTKLLRDTEDGARQYSYVKALTFGYATYGSDYYGNQDVLNDIKYCLEWMYRHAYGDDMIEGRGWRDPKLPNWWYMFIGAPEKLTEILLILYKEITLEDRRRYLKCFEWIASWMCLGPSWRKTRIKVCTEYGVLLHSPKYLIQEAEDFDAELMLDRSDYVCFTHTYPHNMSYGGIYLSRFLYITAVLAGTPMEYNSPNSYKQFFRVKYMYEPAMYKGQGFWMLAGRYTKQMVEASKSAGFLVHLLSMIGVFGEDEDRYLKQFLKSHSVNETFRDTIIKSASFLDLAKFEEILADDTIPYEVDYEYAHAWYTGDRAAQHRNNYALGVAMSSCRHINYESILHENKTGWYSGDGAFHTYTSYDSEQYDGDNFINNINIAYRFPGTTEDMQKREARGISFGPWKAPNTFAGSMAFDKKYITAGMDFVSEYCDHDDHIYDEVKGESRAEHHNDLVGKKSWFLFDDEAVLLGAGITSTMNSPVNTTVEHRRIVKDELFGQTVGTAEGEIALPKCEFEERYKNPGFVEFGGHAGYVFLGDTDLYVSRYNYTTNIEQPYLEIRIEHGENPKGAGYAYAVLPYATADKLAAYHKNPDVEIISNTETLQAVREKKLGISGYVFYEAGESDKVQTDNGAIIMLGERDGRADISVCDPTHLLTEIKVKIKLPLKLISSDKGVAVENKECCTELTVNCEGSMGAPFRASFELV